MSYKNLIALCIAFTFSLTLNSCSQQSAEPAQIEAQSNDELTIKVAEKPSIGTIQPITNDLALITINGRQYSLPYEINTAMGTISYNLRDTVAVRLVTLGDTVDTE